MNEELLELIYSKFQTKASLEDFKKDFNSDEGLRKASYKKMETDATYDQFIKDVGYLGEGDPKKATVDSTVSPLDSAQKSGGLDTQSTPQEKPISDSQLPIQENKDLENQVDPLRVRPQDTPVDMEMIKLFEQYKEAGVITMDDEANIQKVLDSQEEGDRSVWETMGAYTDGMLKTGYMIPLYKWDKESELKDKRESSKKAKFLEALPNDKRVALNNFAINRSAKLDNESVNILAQNEIIQEKSKLVVQNLKHMQEGIDKITESGKSVPKEGVESYRELYSELQSLTSKYNSNVDLIESNNNDIGSFAEEVDLLKKNFTGIGYYKDLARLSTADMLSGIAEMNVSSKETLRDVTGVDLVNEEEVQMLNEFRDEVSRQRDLLKPVMSVEDIETSEDFGGWLMEQTATQLPTLTVLLASGGSSGLAALGASSAGTKMGDMKDSNRKGQTDYTQAQIYLAGIGNGTMEVLSERITLGILSKGKRALSTMSRAEVKRSTSSYVKGFFVDSASEGASEFGNTMSQNLIDMLYLGKTDVHVFDNTLDALASGMAMGAGMNISPTAIGIGSKAFMPKENSAKLSENSRKIEGLLEELELKDKDLTQGTKDLLQSRVDALVKEQGKTIEQAFEAVAKMDKKDIQKLVNLDKQANKIISSVKDIKSSELPDAVKKDLLDTLKAKSDKLVAKKTELLNKKPDGIKPKTEKTTVSTEGTNSTDTKGDQGGDGGAKVQGKDGKESSVDIDGEGVQQDSSGVERSPQEIRDIKQRFTSDVDKSKGEPIESYEELFDDPEIFELAKKQGVKVVPLTVEAVGKDLMSLMKGQAGSYIGDGVVLVDPKYLDPKNINAGNTKVLQHEVVHAYTVGVLTEKDTSNLKPFEKKFKEDVEAIYESEKGFLNGDYGFKNTFEMVAEFMSNKRFRDYIEGNNLNVFKRIRKAITKFLNDYGLEYKTTNLKLGDVMKDFQDNLQGKDTSNNDSKSEGDGNFNLKSSFNIKTELKKIMSGFPIITYIDEKLFTPLAEKLEDIVANKVKESLVSQNSVKRYLAQSATNWYNGLPRTMDELSERRRISGKQELAFVKGAKVTTKLQGLINSSADSAKRVHSALDPDLYDEADRVSYDDLADNEKLLFDELRALNEKTHETNYENGFISEEVYEKYKGSYIGRGYEEYEGTQGKEDKANFLTNKIFDKIYNQRKAIDQWKIDNKVEDPIYLTVNRMIRTERNMAVKAYADFILKDTKVVSDVAKAGFTKLSGKPYGALDGKYVANYIAEDFKGYFYANETLDKIYQVFQGYDKVKARQFLKKFHTVYNPAVQLGNLMSNHAFAASAGVNVIQLWKNAPSALKEIAEKSGDYLTLIENGIVGTDVLTTDLTLRTDRQGNLKIGGKTKNKIKKLDKWSQKVYSRSDDVMKLSAYKALRASGYTEIEAIQRVFEGFQNYATVGKIWDVASKTPLVGNAYVKFQADLQRIVKNSILKRPLTTATFLAGVKGMAIAASMMSGESEEEREIREDRPFVPKVDLGVTNVPLTFKVGNKEVNLARYISPYYNYEVPNESFLEKLTSLSPFSLKTDESASGETSQSFDTPDVLLGSFWSAFMANKDFRGKTITDPNANKYTPSGLSTEEKLFNQFDYVGRSVVPLYAPLRDSWLSHQTGSDYFGRDKSVSDIIISRFVKIQTYDDKSLAKTIESSVKTIEYRANIINDKISGIKKQARKDAVKLKKRRDAGRITEETYTNAIKRLEAKGLERITDQMEKLVEQQQKLNKLIDRVQQ
jgi:hypothetical protein